MSEDFRKNKWSKETINNILESIKGGFAPGGASKEEVISDKLLEEMSMAGVYYVEEESRIIEVSKYLHNEIRELLRENISSARGFFLTISGFSLTILGLIISALSSGSALLKNACFAYLGVVFFVVCVVASVLYLLNRFSKENNDLTERLKMQKYFFAEIRALLNDHAEAGKLPEDYIREKRNMVLRYAEKEREFNTKIEERSKLLPHIPKIITYSFLAGLTFVGLAFLDLKFVLILLSKLFTKKWS